jgi:hypothetical protein
LSQEIFQSDLLYHLIQNIAKFEFEVSSYSWKHKSVTANH